MSVIKNNCGVVERMTSSKCWCWQRVVISVTIVYISCPDLSLPQITILTPASDKIVHFLFQLNLFMAGVLTRNISREITGLSFNSPQSQSLSRHLSD